jgi:hypothetical protein
MQRRGGLSIRWVSPRTGPGTAARTAQIALAPRLPTQPGLGLLAAFLDQGRVDVAVFAHGIDSTGPAGRCLFLISGCAFRCVEGGGGRCTNRVDLDSPGLGFLRLGYHYLHHAVFGGGLDGICLYMPGQRDRASEQSVAALQDMELLVGGVLSQLSFAPMVSKPSWKAISRSSTLTPGSSTVRT